MNKLMIVKFLFVIYLCQCVRAEVIQAGTPEVCELKLDGNLKLLSVNESWINTNNPCISYRCNSDVKIEKVQKECNSTCDINFVYKTVPGECCGKCYAALCIDGNTQESFMEGDVWKSADNCTINECVSDGLEVRINYYEKSCPKLRNCPRDNIESRDCCPYCNYRQQRSSSTQINQVELTDRDNYRSHPCLRDCKKGESLTCHYDFIIEQYETMSKACYNCPRNMTDCYRPHCISADGMRRSIIVVNRMFPGPTIEVCLNDTIVVDVQNHLMSEGTSIHWHGMHQRLSPFMDGVPHISQCAIYPGQTFRYSFLADNPGTHMWHSHLGLQRSDGLVGPLIVREVEEFHESLYDFDVSEHILLTMDWIHEPVNSKFTAHYHGRGDNKPSNVLINGRGKYYGNLTALAKLSTTTKGSDQISSTAEISEKSLNLQNKEEEFIIITEELATATEEIQTTTEIPVTDILETTTYNYGHETYHYHQPSHRFKRALAPADEDSPLVPYETFNVVKGNRYRFRHINAGFLNCPIELSIDNHTITAIATDGTNIKPKEVTFLVSYAGERWDFIVNANQEVGNYFIRARGMLDCASTSSFQMAVLHYNGAGDEIPAGNPKSYNFNRSGTTLNALNAPHGSSGSITVAETMAVEKTENLISKQEPDVKFYLSYDFYAKDNSLFHPAGLYGFDNVTFGKIYTPQINHISMKLPHIPAMIVQDLLEHQFCNASSLEAQGINCKETFCQCTHVLQVPLNSLVEMILIDEGVVYEANHMFHLHGNYFHVVGMDRIGTNVSLEQIKELDKAGKLKRKFADSVKKDTVTVPDGGYTIIRLFADNPGLWLMHCHLDFHAEIGMAVILKVGEFDEMLPVPRGFPTCQDYSPSDEVFSSGSKVFISSLPILLLTCVLTNVFS
ncbi:unnamed protein product [Chironomus riparius]|uniref:Uncharacterized protein n=1 Tax=Chironomus riparius TaxID=315576 RepID=A0A9N9S5N2_9DIPT|nr:unnamed protein product [Chironomus riparius]